MSVGAASVRVTAIRPFDLGVPDEAHVARVPAR
jgi:hypothetical protein